MSKLSKKRSYGYYTNLCNKYGFNILKKTYFQSIMINEVERKNLELKYSNELSLK